MVLGGPSLVMSSQDNGDWIWNSLSLFRIFPAGGGCPSALGWPSLAWKDKFWSKTAKSIRFLFVDAIWQMDKLQISAGEKPTITSGESKVTITKAGERTLVPCCLILVPVVHSISMNRGVKIWWRARWQQEQEGWRPLHLFVFTTHFVHFVMCFTIHCFVPHTFLYTTQCYSLVSV